MLLCPISQNLDIDTFIGNIVYQYIIIIKDFLLNEIIFLPMVNHLFIELKK